jgi:hypothetical protein
MVRQISTTRKFPRKEKAAGMRGDGVEAHALIADLARRGLDPVVYRSSPLRRDAPE